MRATTIAAALVLTLSSLASAQDLEGHYDLFGRRPDGERYRGAARIVRQGEGWTLTTRVEDPRWGRPAARASLQAEGGRHVFRFGGVGELDGPAAGASGALSALGQERSLPAGAKRATTTLRLVDLGHCLEGTLSRAGKVLARERLRKRADAGFQLQVQAPRRAHFQPHRVSGPNTVSLRYELDPPREPARVEARIVDREGREVAREDLGEVRDEGAGLEFRWGGQAERGYVDVRRSPFRITLIARRGEEEARAQPVEVRAQPLIDAVHVVSRVAEGEPLDASNKLIAHEARPLITAVVRAIVGGVRAPERGRTERVYFVAQAELPAEAATLAGGRRVQLEAWDAERWGPLELRWQTILPRAVHSPAYRATQDAARLTREGEFTNVVSNGEREGAWIGRDTIEYVHAPAGRGPSPSPDRASGTLRYRVEVDYGEAALRLGAGQRPGSLGAPDPEATTAEQLRSGLESAAFSRSLAGASEAVHRISRRGPSPDPLLSYLEAYRRVPWLYGSLGSQVDAFVGYDCADLVLGAARKAGLTQRSYTNANNLCKLYLRPRGSHPILAWDAAGRTLDARSRAAHPVPVGQEGPEAARPGDVVFFDWDGDGTWDHTTVLWSTSGSELDLDARLVWAHHDAAQPDGFYVGSLRELVHPSRRDEIRMTIRRFER